MTIDPAIDLVLRTALALLFLAAAGHKLRRPARFRATLAEYQVLPGSLVAVGALVVVVTELAVAAALVVPALRTGAALAAALVLAIYGGAIAINLARGRRHIDCGCTGPAVRRPISGWLVVRNGALAAAALALVVPIEGRALVWVDGLTVAAATATLAACYAALDRLLAHAPALARLRGVA